MKPSISKAVSIAFLACVTACATTPNRPRPPRKTANQPLEKAGQKTPTGNETLPQAGANAEGAILNSPQQPAQPQDNTGLWSRVNNTSQALSEEDLMHATQLYPAASGSLEEAIFVVAQMRILQKDWEKSQSFQTQDLHTNQTADNAAGLSLEKTFQDVEVDLPVVLKANPQLKNHDTLILTRDLLAHTKNSDAFKNGVNAVIQERAAEWPDLLNGATAATTAAAPATAAPESTAGTPAAAETNAAAAPADAAAATAAAGTAAAAQPAADPNAVLDTMGSDTLLLAAQKLADKGDYKAALDHVSHIKDKDPFYKQAQEKQKVYSNRAVKDLRSKAAEAFANAGPIADSRAKATYLKQAKNYLEQALKDYPLADHLDTVKDNLEAVNRDLAALEKAGT